MLPEETQVVSRYVGALNAASLHCDLRCPVQEGAVFFVFVVIILIVIAVIFATGPFVARVIPQAVAGFVYVIHHVTYHVKLPGRIGTILHSCGF